MAGKSDTLEAAVLNMVFRNTPFSPPSVLYISLHTADPTDAGQATEVLAPSYSRVGVTTGTAGTGVGSGWSVPAPGTGTVTQISNTVVVTYANPTEDWGVVTHFGIQSAPTGNALLYSGQFSTSRDIRQGDSAPSFAVGAIQITEE